MDREHFIAFAVGLAVGVFAVPAVRARLASSGN